MSENLDKVVTMLDFIDKILVMYSAITEKVLVAPFMLTNDIPIYLQMQVLVYVLH